MDWAGAICGQRVAWSWSSLPELAATVTSLISGRHSVLRLGRLTGSMQMLMLTSMCATSTADAWQQHSIDFSEVSNDLCDCSQSKAKGRVSHESCSAVIAGAHQSVGDGMAGCGSARRRTQQLDGNCG